MIAKPSAEPAPRPAETTTFASERETPPAGSTVCSTTLTARSLSDNRA